MRRRLQSKILRLPVTILLWSAIAGSLVAFPTQHSHAAASIPSLGTAASFAILGATTVTNTGATTLKGDLGVSPGPSCTGFPAPCTGGPGSLSGTVHLSDATAEQAQSDASSAYQFATEQACTTTFPASTDIGGRTLTPGVYCFPSSAGVTGTLTLDAEGNANAIFIFQIGTTLTTASASEVVLINGAQPRNIFWQVGSSATLGAQTSFVGSLVAQVSITVTTSATSNCGLYALTGAVTLDTNSIQTCPANVGDLTLSNDASITMTSSWSTRAGSFVTATFRFTNIVKDHRASGAGWQLQASTNGISNNSTNATISLVAEGTDSTCTNGTCPAITFVPITLTTVPTTFLKAGNHDGTVVVDGDYTTIIDGQIMLSAGAPAGFYMGNIKITLVNTF